MKSSYNVSVIIPVYNAQKYLEECLQSLISQTIDFQKVEILLINDGSQDESGEICKNWEEKYSNIVYYDKKNEGVSATRNLGIKQAKGKYILFLDPDDYLSKNAIQEIVSFFDSHYDEIDMVTFPIFLVYPNGKKKMHSRYKNNFSKENVVYDLNENYKLVQATINVCIKNDKKYFFDTNQFYSEDEQFNTKILMQKKKLGYVRNAIYYYRQHSNSVTSKKNTYDLENVYKFHEQFQKDYQNHPYIQSIILNNFRWRIEEDCLYPNTLSFEEANPYLENVTKRLGKIDFSLFQGYLKESTMMELLALSNQKLTSVVLEDGNYSLYCNQKLLFDRVTSLNEISYLTIENGKIKLEGRIVTGHYYDKKVDAYATIHYSDNDTEQIKLELYNHLNYKNRVSKMYCLEREVSKILKVTFTLLVNGAEVNVVTKNVEWCGKHRVLDSYSVSITNEVNIQKKKFYSVFWNKFRGCRKVSFLFLNCLSLFSKEGKRANLYVGEKDSKLYESYLKDSHKKVFITNPKGLKYKFQLLNCDCLITDQNIRFVLPFGTMRKYYVQAGKFRVIKK